MKIMVQLDVTFYDDNNLPIKGYRTHVINISNEEALEKLVEHLQGPALDNAGLKQDDFIVYDPAVDDKLL